jgi:hypothetical protein
MDSEPLEAAKPDARAQRAKTIIVVLTALFIAVPVILYLFFGNRAAPAQ